MKRTKWDGLGQAVRLLRVLPVLISLTAQSADNMRLHGALVAEPCVIPPGEESIQLDFGTVIDKYLYLNQRTHGSAFTLHLAECDLSLGNMVKVTFSGIENSNLPGLLALAEGSAASGVAIGMETPEGKALPLNKPGSGYPLQEGNTLLTVHAFVQGEPVALEEHKIGLGPFSAITTFTLDYE